MKTVTIIFRSDDKTALIRVREAARLIAGKYGLLYTSTLDPLFASREEHGLLTSLAVLRLKVHSKEDHDIPYQHLHERCQAFAEAILDKVQGNLPIHWSIPLLY